MWKKSCDVQASESKVPSAAIGATTDRETKKSHHDETKKNSNRKETEADDEGDCDGDGEVEMNYDSLPPIRRKVNFCELHLIELFCVC